MLPKTNTTQVIVVQMTTSGNPNVPELTVMNSNVGAIEDAMIITAMRFVVNLSVNHPQIGTEMPPSRFPNVRAPAAAE
jgi:hypothetical protein